MTIAMGARGLIDDQTYKPVPSDPSTTSEIGKLILAHELLQKVSLLDIVLLTSLTQKLFVT